eukprot:scaffold861_cov231-Chaetoceros_neogracile.AAC.10
MIDPMANLGGPQPTQQNQPGTDSADEEVFDFHAQQHNIQKMEAIRSFMGIINGCCADWGGSAKISERNRDGRVLVGGTAELFHEFHALLDSVLWTRLSVLGLDGVRYWALSLRHW